MTRPMMNELKFKDTTRPATVRAFLRLVLDYPKFTLRRKPLDSFAARSATLDETLTFEPHHGAS